MLPLNLFDLPERNAFAVEFVTESLKEMLGRAFTKEAIGPRTSYIFDITARALLSDPDPAPHTVLDMSYIILNNKARSALADRLTDVELAEKLRGFSQLPRESFAAPLNKLEAFFRPSIQGMLGAGENGFNLFRGKRRSLLDAKPIVIADLSGIPRTSAVLIGSVVMALLQLEAFRRDLKVPHDIFHVYVDEVGAFLNLENADLVTRSLQETAKFRMALTMISQGYDVIPPPVQKSLSTNMAALMYFAMGIGSGDARVASQELHGEYTEDELNALPVGHAGARLGRDVFSLYSPDVPKPADDKSAELIDLRTLYPQHYAFVFFGLTTGMRFGELSALTWPDLEESEGVIRVSRAQNRGVVASTKTGTVRTIPLTEDMKQVLTEHRRELVRSQHPGLKGNLVFPADDGGFHSQSFLAKPLRQVCQEIGVNRRFTIHGLRRTYNTLMLRAGVDLRVFAVAALPAGAGREDAVAPPAIDIVHEAQEPVVVIGCALGVESFDPRGLVLEERDDLQRR